MTDLTNPDVQTATSKKKPQRVRIIPLTQFELAKTALSVSTHYTSFHTQLDWMDKAAFAQLASTFMTEVDLSEREGAKRRPITGDIAVLNKEIEANIQFVKDEIRRKFGKDRLFEYFEIFGMEKTGKNWQIPKDHDERNQSLKNIVIAFTAHGMGMADYGIAYWQDLSIRYEDALNRAISSDSLRRTTVEVKNIRRELLVKSLNALIHLVKAFHPDTYESVLYDWGFQRDKY